MDIMSIEDRTDKANLCGCDIRSKGRHKVGESLLVDPAEAVASRLDQRFFSYGGTLTRTLTDRRAWSSWVRVLRWGVSYRYRDALFEVRPKSVG